jgi:tetratricopeptide (TPR) repeat protein/cold shock CspA family protein
MTSYHRVALYVFFDAIEQDLIGRIRLVALHLTPPLLTDEERARAVARLQRRESHIANSAVDDELLVGLDLGDKISVLFRHKQLLDEGSRAHYVSIKNALERVIPIRNAVMHGRPLTTDEYAIGLATSSEFLKTPPYWPTLSRVYGEFANDPSSFLSKSLSSPGYFEVPRTEAFVAYRSGDATRANAAYETALELAPEQPQLHAAYAGFLMRSLGDYATAKKHFEVALDIDPESSALLREAARNYFFLYEFEAAAELITRAWAVKRETFKDEIVLADLQCQLYIRNAERLNQKGDPRSAVENLKRLLLFLKTVDINIVDMTLIEHLRKVLPTVEALRRSPAVAGEDCLDEIRGAVSDLILKGTPIAIQRTVQPALIDQETDSRSGTLKLKGRQPNFGFLVDAWGAETFVARVEVESVVWNDMCAGRPVSFSLTRDDQGRPRATRVTLL